MKKWYQSCGWMLAAALAVELSGCAGGKAYLSRITGRESSDQKLVDVDGKARKKGESSSSKRDSLRDKADDSKLAKRSSSRPKVESHDDSRQELASKPEPASKAGPGSKPERSSSQELAWTRDSQSERREQSDPFMSGEFDALTAARAKAQKAETESAQAGVESSARVQEVAHKVEDNLADLGDLPEWARETNPAPRTAAKREVVKAVADKVSQPPADDVEGRATLRTSAEKPAPRDEAGPVSADLAALCPDAQGELRDMVAGLQAGDIEGLKRGIHRIGRMGPDAKAAAPALVLLLSHKDGFVRIQSALALARIQASPPEAVQTVVDGLKSSDPGMRSFAAAVLAEMGPQAADALTTLAESLKDRDGYVRLHAAEVLIRYDRWSYQALDTLLAGLKDKDENIRWLATYSLAELAPESQETVDALLKATHDPVAKVKIGAVYALGEIGPFAKNARAELRELADSTSNQELQSATLYALQQIEQ